MKSEEIYAADDLINRGGDVRSNSKNFGEKNVENSQCFFLQETKEVYWYQKNVIFHTIMGT